MVKKTAAVLAALSLSVVLVGCGEDDEDCESTGSSPEMVAVAMVDGRSGGTSGGSSSRSGGRVSKPGGKIKKPRGSSSSGGSSGGKVKIDDDLFEECDD